MVDEEKKSISGQDAATTTFINPTLTEKKTHDSKKAEMHRHYLAWPNRTVFGMPVRTSVGVVLSLTASRLYFRFACIRASKTWCIETRLVSVIIAELLHMESSALKSKHAE